jgi:streptogramin lyase
VPPADPGSAQKFAALGDPRGIVTGPDGAYWIAQFAARKLGRLTPQGGYTTLGGLPAA